MLGGQVSISEVVTSSSTTSNGGDGRGIDGKEVDQGTEDGYSAWSKVLVGLETTKKHPPHYAPCNNNCSYTHNILCDNY